MEINNIKCVMIFDESLPVGVIANTAAIMVYTCNPETKRQQ